MRRNYLCAIDIGSSKVAATLAILHKRQVQELVFESQPTKGVAVGTIVDAVEMVGCLGKVLKNLREKSGINVKYVYPTVSGQDIVTKHSYAVIPLAERGNKVIMEYDLSRVMEQARILGSSLEDEIVHQIPASYSIDSRAHIRNPLGLYSHKLEVDLFLICTRLSLMQALTRVTNQSGCELKQVVFSAIATSEIVFDKSLNDGIHVLCDIGKDITEIVVFDHGLIKDLRIIPLGGQDLSNELVTKLSIPGDLAEEVKKSHGSVGGDLFVDDAKEILVKHHDAYKPIRQKEVQTVLDEKARAMCQMIRATVESMVPPTQVNSVTLTGRTLLLGGFIEIFEKSWGGPVRMGRIMDPELSALVHRYDILSGQKYLQYLTSLGVVCRALRSEKPKVLTNPLMYPHLFARAVNKVKEVYLEYF